MRESLREFIRREAGSDPARQLDLIRHLSPSIFIAGGYDFNELRQLIQHGPGWENSFGSEYVSDTWPEVPVTEPLSCITIRPFNPHGYTTTPYELVAQLSWHLRDLQVGAESAPDLDGAIRFCYIEPESMEQWKKAAESWRASLGHVKPPTTSTPKTEPSVRVYKKMKTRREHWLDTAFKTACDQATDPASRMSVWQSLCRLAVSPSPPDPLLGMLGKKIKCRRGGGHELFSYDNFYQYWRRRMTPPTAG